MRSAYLTLGIVCLLLLSACGIGGSSDNDDTPTATTAATAVAAQSTATARSTNAPAATAAATAASTQPPASPASTATTEAASPTATDGAEPTQAGIDPDLADEIAEIEREMVNIRGLELREDVPITVISREELRQNLIEDVTADYSQEEADQDTSALWLLRLIEDPTLDLYAFQIDLLSEQVLGYYDPELDEMFIVSEADGLSALAEFTLAHELVHAAQDQHFNLMEVRFYDQGDADRDTAAVAVIEGDAEMVQLRYIETMDPAALLELLTEAGTLSSEVVDYAPPYLRESLYF
ncbi:MAG: hypothetical protein WD628_04115, partial [Thermomicrobiales bacterium]